ncbi:hypothetical protein LOAG_04950 [Loa loa]|uniref:Uncharacterized protein n=1 Tax=Loa loa TaxID=7209 RepID=A0A1S0U1A6_LOALO|nr:hypothetical protein LOAG_04950 [Loa loa]EFO23535.1 hypothetical protein LOAG_04950 [Loa loa]
MIFCTFINYNSNMSLVLDIDDNQMEKCIQEIQNGNWKEIQSVPDDMNNSITQFFYIFEEPFVPKNAACFSNDTTDDIYNITIACMNSIELSVELNNTTEYFVSLLLSN